MPIPLSEVLADPSLATAEPVVLAGEAGMSRPVRWVHTSEVPEIADLLSGGELLLVGGVSLATASEEERNDYLRALAARGVAALAIETGQRLPRVPDEMITMARQLGLPLIELRKVVPFVAVTEAINGLLINESVRRLQLADRVSHALATALAEGGDLQVLLDVLARVTGAAAELISLTGEPIAQSNVNRGQADTDSSARVVTAPVTTAGVTVAMLVLRPGPGSDSVMLDAARNRATEAVGLALLRSRPLPHRERDAREFLAIAKNGANTAPRFTELANRLGVADRGPYVCVVARLNDYPLWASGVEGALRRRGRRVISHLREDSYVAVVAMDGGSLGLDRAQVVADLVDAPLPRDLRIVVGPGSPSLAGIHRCLRETEACFAVTTDTGTVIDALDVSVERLLGALAETDVLDAFIEEQLGELLTEDARRRGVLLDTLSAYLRHWGSKTETAKALHLQRQSLYQRLAKIFDVLGEIPPGSARLGSLVIAVELEAARRRTKM